MEGRREGGREGGREVREGGREVREGGREQRGEQGGKHRQRVCEPQTTRM